MNDSYIGVNSKGECSSFVGSDAVNYVRAELLASSLRLYAECKIIPTRGVTATKMLKMATGYTGKAYKRGQYLTAACDVKKWADEMKAALPKERG
jgi:hypothetical protein